MFGESPCIIFFYEYLQHDNINFNNVYSLHTCPVHTMWPFSLKFVENRTFVWLTVWTKINKFIQTSMGGDRVWAHVMIDVDIISA